MNQLRSQNLAAAAASLGLADSYEDLETKAKRCVAQRVTEVDSAVLKESAKENIDALRLLIWPGSKDPTV
ncbi:hypothetical protein GCM10010974_08760 [Brevibacterium sediminis]|uniref:DUF892 family protein n=1 Tax=Brevibacterium sediminis TaxID=1857024 RepID=A0ABQ1LS65_9MICO|nr:hypothetical protein GCM10010974_08760 [Brevibacterium sediminis]